MDGQPERCYAVEQLKALQGSIDSLLQNMVFQRARVEKYKDTDLAAARDTFAELQQVRKRLAQAIGDARLLLMEAEEYQTAKTAAMLQAGLLRFDLMSNVYRPVYDAIQNFIKEFPVEGTANAAVIGRLMNNVKLPCGWRSTRSIPAAIPSLTDDSRGSRIPSRPSRWR